MTANETSSFPLGEMVITKHALLALHPQDATAALGRHATCDWVTVLKMMPTEIISPFKKASGFFLSSGTEKE